jgi:hypothetical protein
VSSRAATVLALLTALPFPATAQEPAALRDSASSEIQATLREFYFNLAHRDWEALASEILPAKVMASHPVPERLLAVADHATRADSSTACSPDPAARVEHATITLVGEWARASVPQCPPATRADQFRLVRFEHRWRIIHIELSPETAAVQLAR